MAKPPRRVAARPKTGVSNPLAQLLSRTGIATPALVTPKAPGAHTQVMQLLQAKELAQARDKVEEILRQSPADMHALNLKAVIAAQMQQSDVAEGIWRELLARDPRHVDARSNLGRLLQLAGRHEESIQLLQQAVEQNPQHADAHLNLGVVLDRVGRHDEAMASYRRCLALAPNNAQALFNLGKVLQDGHDFAAAHDHYRRALQANPLHDGAFANLIFTEHYLPTHNPAGNRDTARQFSATLVSRTASLPARRAVGNGPLRVGLVSADLRIHPVGYFLQNVAQQLDSTRVALIGYANSNLEDALTASLRARCETWHTIEPLSDAAVAALIAQDGIDVLLDLSGMTAGHRQALFALKPAPVQASWLGYFATTGQLAMDYVLADPVCVPKGEEHFFVEKVWRLPHIRYCFSPPEQASSVALPPAQHNDYITFGCFQTLPKINARVLRCWAAILDAVPSARLRLQNGQLDTDRMRSYFDEQLRAAGLPLDRVEMVGNQPRAEYLNAYAQIDIALDTFPYPGGTTTAEALWMGVPTLTLALPGMLGRQGEAMLAAVGLHDWITRSEDDYIAQAVAWGQADADRIQALADLRAGLREKARLSPLFDAPRFARDLEDALWGMWNEASKAPA